MEQQFQQRMIIMQQQMVPLQMGNKQKAIVEKKKVGDNKDALKQLNKNSHQTESMQSLASIMSSSDSQMIEEKVSIQDKMPVSFKMKQNIMEKYCNTKIQMVDTASKNLSINHPLQIKKLS